MSGTVKYLSFMLMIPFFCYRKWKQTVQMNSKMNANYIFDHTENGEKVLIKIISTTFLFSNILKLFHKLKL